MRNFILGSDWSSDCDDVVAMRLFCRAHKEGKINLLGVNIDDNLDVSARSLSAFMTNEGCGDIPIGFDRKAKRVCKRPTYQNRMCSYPSRYTTNDQAEESVAFYRRLIASASGDVEIAEIGFTQALAALLKSKGDIYSPLSGYELVRSKVKKLWVMGGKWDEQGGKEHNFIHTRATKRGAAYICKNCPVPITFLGFEIGLGVLIGGASPEGDILKNALIDYGCDPEKGRDGWDPMLAQLAIIGDEEKAGYSVVRGKARVCALTGKNYFFKGEGSHLYVIKAQPDDYYVKQINALI